MNVKNINKLSSPVIKPQSDQRKAANLHFWAAGSSWCLVFFTWQITDTIVKVFIDSFPVTWAISFIYLPVWPTIFSIKLKNIWSLKHESENKWRPCKVHTIWPFYWIIILLDFVYLSVLLGHKKSFFYLITSWTFSWNRLMGEYGFTDKRTVVTGSV